tara:strand:- start:116 stop:373 length:258 start_codon:yes stop_codon:yes gene_type:complete
MSFENSAPSTTDQGPLAIADSSICEVLSAHWQQKHHHLALPPCMSPTDQFGNTKRRTTKKAASVSRRWRLHFLFDTQSGDQVRYV